MKKAGVVGTQQVSGAVEDEQGGGNMGFVNHRMFRTITSPFHGRKNNKTKPGTKFKFRPRSYN